MGSVTLLRHQTIRPQTPYIRGEFNKLFNNHRIYIYIRGACDKFPDFFRMGTFIDSTHMIL